MARSRSRTRTRGAPKAPTEAERHYEALLAEQARSGLGLREFARRRGLPASRLQWWRSELRRRAKARGGSRSEAGLAGATPALLPVRVADATGVALSSAGRWTGPSRGYEVCLAQSGHSVRIPEGFAPDQLSLLVRVLEGAC